MGKYMKIQHAINKACAVELHEIGFTALVETEHHDAPPVTRSKRLQPSQMFVAVTPLHRFNRRNMPSCHKETIVMIMYPLVI